MPETPADPSPSDTDEPPRGDAEPEAAFSDFFRQIEQLGSYLTFYFTAKFDRTRASFRRILLHVSLIAVAILALAGALATAVVLLMMAIAGALGGIFHRAWVGDLLCGGGFLALFVGGLLFLRVRLLRRFRDNTVRTYQRRQRDQRAKHGTDVHERAQTDSSENRN